MKTFHGNYLLVAGFILITVLASLIPSDAASQAGRGCSPWNWCSDNHSCMPLRQVCHRDSGAKVGEACQLGFGCARGLNCEAGSQVCRSPGREGDPCHLTRPCASGFSCQPGVHQCYPVPREVGQPCVAGHECGKGLHCQSFLQKCTPNEVKFSGRGPCRDLFVQATAEDARRLGATMSFGVGAAASGGKSASVETGLVYGENGQFGCYLSACIGYEADVSKSGFVNIGITNRYDSFAGFSVDTSQGVDTPFVKLGFQTSQSWSADPPAGAISKPGDLIAKQLIGTSSGLSYGVGLSPVTAGAALCFTAVLDGEDPLDQFKGVEDLLAKWAAVGFDPNKIPHHLLQLAKVEPGAFVTASFRSAHGRFLSGRQDGNATANAPARREWERWRLVDLNGGNLSSGDRVTLRSTHNMYLVAEEDLTVRANRISAQAYEKWEITAHNKAIGEKINSGDLVSLRSYHSRYLVAEQNGVAKADRTQIGPWERWTIRIN